MALLHGGKAVPLLLLRLCPQRCGRPQAPWCQVADGQRHCRRLLLLPLLLLASLAVERLQQQLAARHPARGGILASSSCCGCSGGCSKYH